MTACEDVARQLKRVKISKKNKIKFEMSAKNG